MTRPIGSKNRKPGLGPRRGLHLRISEADRAAFDAAAARAGVKTAEWIRTVLRREAGLWTGGRTMGRAQYRVVVGERGNEQGHIMPVDGGEVAAHQLLSIEVARYGGDGWGRVEVNHGSGWERLDSICR